MRKTVVKRMNGQSIDQIHAFQLKKAGIILTMNDSSFVDTVVVIIAWPFILEAKLLASVTPRNSRAVAGIIVVGVTDCGPAAFSIIDNLDKVPWNIGSSVI